MNEELGQNTQASPKTVEPAHQPVSTEKLTPAVGGERTPEAVAAELVTLREQWTGKYYDLLHGKVEPTAVNLSGYAKSSIVYGRALRDLGSMPAGREIYFSIHNNKTFYGRDRMFDSRDLGLVDEGIGIACALNPVNSEAAGIVPRSATKRFEAEVRNCGQMIDYLKAELGKTPDTKPAKSGSDTEFWQNRRDNTVKVITAINELAAATKTAPPPAEIATK